MSVTATKKKTIRSTINNANLNELATSLQKAKLGNMLEPIKVTFTALTAAAAIDITTAASKAAGVIAGGFTLDTGEVLPAIGQVLNLRVTASGTAGSVGSYVTGDAAATPAIPPTATAYAGAALGLATVSDNGKTLTFPNTITAFVLTYLPRSDSDVDADYSPSV